MTTLYEHPLSPYVQKVKIALAEKGVPFESQIPNLLAGKDDTLTAANPRVEVPTLVDDGRSIFDSTIILDYIEERWPKPPLLPADPFARAQARMIEEMCDTYYEAINWGIFEVRFFGRASGEPAEKMLRRAVEQTAGANAWLERYLGDRPYFDGESFGRGDLSAAPVVNAAATVGNGPAAGSRLSAWLDRVRERPSVKAAFDAANSVMAGSFDGISQLIASGAFVREYRDHRLEWMMRSGGVEIVLDGMKKGNIRFSHEL